MYARSPSEPLAEKRPVLGSSQASDVAAEIAARADQRENVEAHPFSIHPWHSFLSNLGSLTICIRPRQLLRLMMLQPMQQMDTDPTTASSPAFFPSPPSPPADVESCLASPDSAAYTAKRV